MKSALLVNIVQPSLIKFPRGQWLCMVLELYLVNKYNTSILKGEYGSFVTGTMMWGGCSGTTLVIDQCSTTDQWSNFNRRAKPNT